MDQKKRSGVKSWNAMKFLTDLTKLKCIWKRSIQSNFTRSTTKDLAIITTMVLKNQYAPTSTRTELSKKKQNFKS